MRLKGTVLFILALSLIALFVAVVLFTLFSGASLWLYAIIYFVLIFLWYKPVLVFYHSFRAGHMLKQGDLEGVSLSYQHIARLKRNEGYGDYAQGLAYYYQRDWHKAKAAFERALERGIKTQKKTMEPLTRMALMAVNMQLGKKREAMQWMNEIEEQMNTGNHLSSKLLALFYTLKGEWLYHQGQQGESEKAFELAHAHDADLIGEEAYYYAKLLVELGKEAQAKRVLKRLLDPQNKWEFLRVDRKQAEKLLQTIG
ncbi:tetratricopeptide (TPR) repeat protein [Caldalkalibacillus uzonensis]|uniref:Tetratricopeptide (TPR) repeat protein n=1 Tax=Caldalkalibacillus uzonensis TaxID=353224 RepID=A0ABU0CTR7_9BACI|nr:hypothetical protein [Caldalkalibacillus uzonensis]MDQ0339821.1 tetratricopeptide (TPR) repeat protein [Caldalkalibacillus uzonensis]